MDIAIYQIDMDRDKNRMCYLSLEHSKKYQTIPGVDSAIYDKVFEGTVECQNLENVYEMFNLYHPRGYRGRSLSVSDVVEVKSCFETAPGFYFCDSFGFKNIDFDTSQCKELYSVNIARKSSLEKAR